MAGEEEIKLFNPKENSVIIELVHDGAEEFDITFGGGLVNHFAQTLTALAELGASNEQLKTFAEQYAKDTGYGKLEKLRKASFEITEDNLHEHLHTKAAYPELRQYWNKQLQKTGADLKAVLKEAFEKKPGALFGAAFHPQIQVGVGVKVSSPIIVAAGLAHADNIKGGGIFRSPAVAADAPKRSLAEIVSAVYDEFRELGLSLQGEGKRFVHIVEEAIPLAGPRVAEMIATWDVSPDNLQKAFREVELVAAAAYAGVFDRGCDFFLLHGITSFWSLKSILELFLEDDKETALRILKDYLFYFLIAYIGRKTPVPSFSVSQKRSLSLSEILTTAINSPDEHLPKLVVALLESSIAAPEHTSFFLDLASHSLLTVVTPTSYVF